MAVQKKITQLTEITAPSQDDLFLIVDDPAGTPINKKLTLANLLANVNFITSSSGSKDGFKQTITSNVSHAAATLVAGRFAIEKNAGISGNDQFAISGTSHLHSATSNITHTHAVAKLRLDVGNAAALAVNTYGLIIEVANTNADGTAATRQAAPQAFLCLSESVTSPLLSMQYLMDIGKDGAANVSANATANAGNTQVVFTTASNTANTLQVTHKLKLRINGTDYWVCVSNSA